jgi:amino acid adenylation domain-containing protein
MNYPVGKVLREHARLRVEKVESFQRTNFGLSLVVAPGSQLGLHLGYDTNSFEAAAAARVAGQLKGLLESIAADPEQRLSDLSLLTDEERRQLVFGWNDTARPFLRETCLHELFERQAALTPSAAAVVSGGERLTYAELDSRANRLANHLRAGGVGPETRVAILMERSAELVVSILGVLKAGGCYVPLDAQYPRERIAYTLDDSGASLILTQARLAGRLPGTAARVLKVDAEWERVARASGEKPAGGACSQNLVYVIYTSGSTGAPKGVMVSHRELVNYLVWCRGVFEVGEGHGSPIHAPVAFDGTKTSLFFPLTVGQSLLMIPEESGVEGLVESFRSGDRYSLVKLTPAHLDVLSQELSGAELEGRARTLIVGGEALWGENLRHWIRHAPGTRLIQEYGPTETTVSSCWYEIPRDESLSGAVPIGRPISNTQVFILDGAGNPAPVGATGEVYIGGAGLARGYWNRPALTAERFVPDPFSREAGARLYKTGDLAKFLPDGNVEFVGRADSQVKLRGFRVEPGEIEAVLCQHPSVAEAAVVVRTDGGGQKCLVAYVAGEQQTPPAAALREHLKAKLPEHMIPSAFVALDRLPLTPNGKVDRKALPAPAAADREAGRDYVAPRTPEEEIIAAIWQKVLGVRRVGITDNFLQLGGHSLLATQVMSRVRRALGVALPLRALFEAPTVRELAARATQARGAGGAAAKPLTAVRRDAPLPLSFAQQRLWFMHQLEGGSPFYNLPLAVRLGGRLNIAALRRSLDELVRRHESLRTTFSVTEAGQPLQVISPPARVPLPVIDLSGLAESACEAETRRLSAAEARLSFDLGRGPLLRCSLLRLGDEEHVALFTMHHVVSDAWSLGVLVREVAALYAAYAGGRESPLEELPVQYADYAAWQREWLRGEALERQLAYWRDQLAGAPPVLELPTDRPRPPVQTYRGALETFQLAPQLSEQLRELSRASGATLFMTLLAAFKVLLARYSRQDDITVGTVIAGRNREETEPLIGFFINTLVLRTHTAGDPSFVELLGRVRETCLGAYAHQDVPFEKLVEELRPERSLGRTPLFQVAFGVDNAPKSTLELPGLRLDILGGDHGAARFDLTLWVYEAGERLTGVWTYSTDLFDPPTIKRLSGHFEKLLQGVAADPEGRLSSFELVTEEERRLRAEEERRREEAHARRLLGVRRKAVTPGRETAA